MNILNYTENTSTRENIYDHFHFCDHEFLNHLNSRVNISDYSQKLFSKAHRFEAWENNNLVGLLAIYYNENNLAYITDMSVSLTHTNNGIASHLLGLALDKAKSMNAQSMELEVNLTNAPALALYKKHGFAITSERNGMYLLTLHKDSIR